MQDTNQEERGWREEKETIDNRGCGSASSYTTCTGTFCFFSEPMSATDFIMLLPVFQGRDLDS